MTEINRTSSVPTPWLNHYQDGVPQKIDYETICVPEFLERSAKDFPDNTSLVFQGYKVSFSDLDEMVNRFATALAGFGVKEGDAVAILLPNIIPCVIAFYATLRIGAVAVMNNPLYSDRELEHQLNDSGSKVLITLDLLGNRMIDLRPKTKIKEIVITSIGDYLPFPKSFLFKLVAKKKKLAADVKPAHDLHGFKDMIARALPTPPKAGPDLDRIAVYQYTGGTTGVSKGAMLSHGNLSKQVQQLASWFPDFLRGDGMMLGALPIFHVFGLMALNLSVYRSWGYIMVPKPQPEQLLEAIHKFRPTFAPLVPTMLNGILNHPNLGRTDLSSIRGCFSGSAPLPVEVIKAFEEKTGAVIVEGFGLTEASPTTHINPFAGGERKVGSVGVPIPDTICRAVSLEDGKTDVPDGDPGELLIKGPQVMQGYLNMPEETAKTIKDGWLHTGDVVKIDKDGYFYIVDRIKDMIIAGGYNVYPRDIDEVLYEHPKVLDACTIGVPHPHRGEAVKSFVVLKEGETATEEEIIKYCSTKLAKYKLPNEIEFRDDLPKTMVGKILRKELKKEELAKRNV